MNSLLNVKATLIKLPIKHSLYSYVIVTQECLQYTAEISGEEPLKMVQ
jgi:hypothetical protein